MHQNIKQRIEGLQKEGKSKEDIYQELLKDGVRVHEIEDAYGSLSSTRDAYDSDSRTIRIILVFAVLLVGAGVFSFIASNWQHMPKAVKLSVIIFFMVASYVAGWYVLEKKKYHTTGVALYLLGSIIYGSGIFLVAQMYNIHVYWADGFVLWMLGCLALFLATRLGAFLGFVILLGLISIFGYPETMFGVIVQPRFFMLTSSWLLLLASLAVFAAGWLLRKDKKLSF